MIFLAIFLSLNKCSYRTMFKLPTMDTKEVVGRFEAEGQTNAIPEPPSETRTHDAESTDPGRPHFVMRMGSNQQP